MKDNKPVWIYYSFLIVLLLFFIFFALQIGSFYIPPSDIWSAVCQFFSHSVLSGNSRIVLGLRLPRIVISIAAGAMLAVSGVVYQTLLRNPLAEPFTLGVSTGATFGVSIAVFISEMFAVRLWNVPFAFVGGVVTLAVLFSLVAVRNLSLYTLIFVGIAISYFFNAMLTLLLSLLGDRSYEILMWMFGSFANPPNFATFAVYLLICVILIILIVWNSAKLDMFYLPDDLIATSGINLKWTRIGLLSIASVGTIFSVSLCGVVGFVGLIVPHICRLLFGSHHKRLLVSSILLGGMLMLVSDTLARSLVAMTTTYGRELPVGVVTSILGVPFFVFLLLDTRRFHRY